jgi:hypothetical protein
MRRTLKKNVLRFLGGNVHDLQEEIGGIHPLDPLGVQLSTPVHLHHPVFEKSNKKKKIRIV